MTITYKDSNQHSRVYLDKKHVGDIMCRISGKWFYAPKGSKKSEVGEDMASRDLVKKSLENPPPDEDVPCQ